MSDKQEKVKTGRKTLTVQQEQYCKLVAVQGMKPLDAMLKVYESRAGYSIGNQNMLLKKLENNEKVIERLKELYLEIRENQVLGDLYSFNEGAKILVKQIERANEKYAEGYWNEGLHRIILTSIQELNRMYGFNLVDRSGNTGTTVNVTFVDVNQHNEAEVFEYED